MLKTLCLGLCFLVPTILFVNLPNQIMKMDIQFLTPLRVSPYQDNYFTLDEDYIVRVNDKTIKIHKKFITDFASVPKWLTPFFPINDTRTIEPAVIHDYLYRFREFNREESDSIFYHALVKKKYPKWKAFCMWLGVRTFGYKYWE